MRADGDPRRSGLDSHPAAGVDGNDRYHPESTSRAIAELAPDVTFVEDWKDGASPEQFDSVVRAFLANPTP